MSKNSCTFCNLVDALLNEKFVNWYDKPIKISKDFIAIPALGQLVPGYLIIITIKHLNSFSELNLLNLFKLRIFCNEISRIQKYHWDSPVIFEHGSGGDIKKSGASISHAHWHLIPGNFNLLDNEEFVRIKSFQKYSKTKKNSEPYLYFEKQNHESYIIKKKNPPSQYLRRKIATELGMPEKWDYELFPFFENIHETYRCI